MERGVLQKKGEHERLTNRHAGRDFRLVPEYRRPLRMVLGGIESGAARNRRHGRRPSWREGGWRRFSESEVQAFLSTRPALH